MTVESVAIDKNYRVLVNIGGYIPPFCGVLWRQPGQREGNPNWGIWKNGALPLNDKFPCTFWAINLWRFRFHIPAKRGIDNIKEVIKEWLLEHLWKR